MAASVPLYLTGSPPAHVGVPDEKSPQSTTVTLSLPDSGFVESLSTGVPRVSVKAPARLPVLPMSTVPVAAGPPGRSPLAVRTAAAGLEFEIDSEPVANVLPGFADVAVKSAPEAAVTPTATNTVASAASVRRGRWTRTCSRDIWDAPEGSVAKTCANRRAGQMASGPCSVGARRRQPGHLAVWTRPLALRPRLTTGLP